MSAWDSFPDSYRESEIRAILRAVRAGACVSIVGLSGAGKSNVAGFLVNRAPTSGPDSPHFILVDANRLRDVSPHALYDLMPRSLGNTIVQGGDDPLLALERSVETWLSGMGRPLSFVIDRFGLIVEEGQALNNLCALRDTHKYRLTYVVTTRRPIPASNEFAELLLANTIWIGPLSESDARWNVRRFADRYSVRWNEETSQALIRLSDGYPSMLRAAAEAHVQGCALERRALLRHPAVQRRVTEFWEDEPDEEALHYSRLQDNPLLLAGRVPSLEVEPGELTAKEHLLLKYFRAHPGQVCDKDELIRAVWPEDRIFEEGVRDNSLAQLVRRLRQNIEVDPANPAFIRTVTGRGYLFRE